MSKFIASYFPVLLLLLGLAGCSGARVLNAEKAEGINLSAYKTFDFFQVDASGDTISTLFQERITKLEDAIALEMQQKGYLLSKTDPDLLINIGLVVDEQTQTRRTDFVTDAPRYIGQRRYSWKSEEVEVGRYRQGTVTVDLVDRIKNTLVWKGTVQDIIPKKEPAIEATIRKGISKLFKKFG